MEIRHTRQAQIAQRAPKGHNLCGAARFVYAHGKTLSTPAGFRAGAAHGANVTIA
jgi:hypothetical protein